ncbi:putative disease resistance protein At1g50180 [Castanea sativa]|uniref:putative disease resistance protein At1g50180 n=1 Tax=Castanea sativa TaxID=21020 RepID=UPI003F6517D9
MVESVVSSVVSGVVTRIGNLLLQEAIYLNGVRDNVQELQTELTLMQCFLKDADARQNESAIVKQSLAEMKDLAYDAEDVIATYALTVASRQGGGVQKALKRCCSILDEGISVHKVGSTIDSIKTRVSSLKQSFQDYGIISESIVQAGGPSSSNETREQRQTFSHLEDDPVGFDDNLNELVEFLLKEEEGIRVASICGMGGLGKTTLAKMVYHDQKVKQHFGRRAWVYISQQCQRRQVWEDILIGLSQMGKDEIRKLNEADIVDKLHHVQKERRCLVVLDDIWNDESWNNLRHAFPFKDTKSKILLTSRIQQVSRYVDPGGFLYELQPLNDATSLELLEKIVLSRRKDFVTKTYMEEFGKEIIGYCGGLPLAITTLGGLLATKQKREEWEDVLRHVKSHLYEEQNSRVMKVLGLSYNDLPWHLKPCFLYLGHFPEDFEIKTNELIRMWIAEGFISQNQHGGGREDAMEDVGDRYLRELVERCMVLVGERDRLGRISTSRMHDLMRDFCISKAQEENFLHITNILSMKHREEKIGKVRRLAIISESGDDACKGIKFNEYPYLRSLLHLLPNWDHQSYFKASCFKKFKLVRVLHLNNFKNHNRKLPKDIGCLIHLRYLSLAQCRVCNVPSSIGNLRCLETLDLRIHFYPSSISENVLGKMRLYLSKPRVPNVFMYMKQLKHLYLPGDYRVCGKLELGNLYHLQTLGNVQPKTIQIPAGFKFNRLRDLVVKTTERAQDDALNILVSICPHIYMLSLFGVIKKFPEAHQFSPNIAEMSLLCTSLEEDPMAILEKLPNLKSLRLVNKAFLGKSMVCSERGFPRLQSLYLWRIHELEELRVEEGAMSSLQRLKIGYCMVLRTIPDGLRFITTLKELEIEHLPKSFKDRLGKGGPDFYKVQHVPSLVFLDCDEEG